MKKRTVKDIDVAGKRVLLRVDFNVPIDQDWNIRDCTRLKESIPTISYLLERKAKVIVLSHLGRPKGKVVPELRLDPVAKVLGELLGRTLRKLDDCVGAEVKKVIDSMQPAEVVMLENVRFYKEEEMNDDEFARQLASLADVFVNDAFGAAHRAHASISGIPKYLPAAAGFLMEKEIESLSSLLENPAKPFVGIVGGAKVSDKIGVLENLLWKVDRLLIGGGMANTFMAAEGYEMGKSLVEYERLDVAQSIFEKAQRNNVDLQIPMDLVVSERAAEDSVMKVVEPGQVPPGWMVLDIGPRTRKAYASAIEESRTVFWNGPVGMFEISRFRTGTLEIAQAIARCNGTTVVGGGDSIAALEISGVKDKITHISTGGGASLEFLEGRPLPGVVSLPDAE